jgi:hypothetical protein
MKGSDKNEDRLSEAPSGDGSLGWRVFIRSPAFRWLSVTQAAGYAGDTLVAIGLAGTLFFDVPSAEARGKVALYLLLTLAPFAVLSPLLPRVFSRLPNPYRLGLVGSGGLRALIALTLVLVGLDSIWMFPLAFGLLVFGRLHGIARSSLLPLTLPKASALVAANSFQAQMGLLAGGVAVPIGAVLMEVSGPEAPLALAVVAFAGTAVLARAIDAPSTAEDTVGTPDHAWAPSFAVRISMIATALIRSFHGFLILLLAFAFKEADARLLDFGALLGAAGAGYGLASFVVPWLERRLREEPMVVSAFAIQAVTAFIAARFFGLTTGAIVAAAAGVAWGTAKFAFDGMLQHHTEPDLRGLAFTRSETLFQMAWVLGAIVPVTIALGATAGLVMAGVAALVAQSIVGISLFLSARRSH